MKRFCMFGLLDWNGCTCRRCGKTRDEEHDWDGCKCRHCGKTRDEEHDWDGCQCRRCKNKRDKEHDWNGCKCRRCGEMRDEGHDWEGCTCRRCGKTRDEGHDWERVSEGVLCGCDTCPDRAGPGDWGMCMPETGGGCMSQGHSYYDEVNRCKRCGTIRDDP